MTLSRENLLLPVLPRETVQVGPLGGEVIVRGMLLRERLDFMGRAAAADADGIALTYELVHKVTSLTDGKPVFTVEEWEVFSSVETEAFFALLAVAQRLNGMDAEAVKKS